MSKMDPFTVGYRAGLRNKDYMKGNCNESQEYIDWFKGWRLGKAIGLTEQFPAPRHRRSPSRKPSSQPVRRLEYLRRVGRLGAEPF